MLRESISNSEPDTTLQEESLVDRQLNDDEREAHIDQVTKEVIDRRRSTYEELAQGADFNPRSG